MITTPADIACQDAPRPHLSDLELSLTKEQQDALISALSDRNRTLNDIAEEFNASIEALSLYTARAEISKRLDAADQLVARRIRMQATKVLPLVIDTLTECVRSFQWEETHVLIDRNNLAVLEQRRRARETARKASALLLRLSTFQSTPTKKPKAETSSGATPQGATGPSSGRATPRTSPPTTQSSTHPHNQPHSARPQPPSPHTPSPTHPLTPSSLLTALSASALNPSP